MNNKDAFVRWFRQATGNEPYPFQIRFACETALPELVDVPTGLGKTAMAVLGWLWRRRFDEENVRKATPRRLVYGLPMRVLVEQTVECALDWLDATDLLAGSVEREPPRNGKRGKIKPETYKLDADGDRVCVHVLMGGEDEEDWDIYPEYDQIIVGTQDMLLSRALNRGYAATRSRWPMKFGLLHTDCLSVFDEVQLMGSGLATTTQLEAFRRLLPDKNSDEAKNGHGCRSVWMSATLQRDWLKTVDCRDYVDSLAQLQLNDDDHENGDVSTRWTAKKPLGKTNTVMGDVSGLANEVREAHQPGTRTIVIVNTVKRACELFKALNSVAKSKLGPTEPAIVLLHSRFRPEDRKKQVERALAPIKADEPGTIVVSTQVIEAGVDVSATTLFTEVAPWASLVQRFGRCNRRGEANDHAAVYWIAMRTKDSDAEKLVAPYELKDLKTAVEQLEKLSDVGLKTLRDNSLPLFFEHTHVIRRKDLVDLFDTTPDLAGNDIDIDRFIRDVEESDVRVFWRDYGKNPNEADDKEAESAQRREELCPAPIGEFKKFATDNKRKGLVWRWSFLDNEWERAEAGKIVPGQVFLVHINAGGYSSDRGWDLDSTDHVEPISSSGGPKGSPQDATDKESLSHIDVWQTIAAHTNDLCKEVDRILNVLPISQEEADGLRHAARWHDRGKAHEIFRSALPDGSPDPAKLWAKAPGKWKKYNRRHFRHELASALSVIDPRHDLIPQELRDLVAYLVAAHHGKVRLSIRSLPNEQRPDGSRRFARGIWDNDELPATDLGGNGNAVIAPAVRLSLEPMELGLCEQEPFRGLPSWAERMLGLRDRLGPFRLVYLEAVLRAADMRASRDAEQRAVAKQQTHVSPDGKEAAS